MTDKLVAIPDEVVLSKIYMIRNQKVMLDSDLAELYGVETGRLNEQVKRNSYRFPPDFMFQLSNEEWEALISQFARSNKGRGGRRKLPYAFTEHGVLMLSSVLNSKQAIELLLKNYVTNPKRKNPFKTYSIRYGKIANIFSCIRI